MNRELKQRRIANCSCQMPLPFQIEPPDEVSANWRIGTPTSCARGCDALIVEIVAQFWPQYDLLVIPGDEDAPTEAKRAESATSSNEG